MMMLVYSVLFWCAFFIIGNLFEKRYFSHLPQSANPYATLTNSLANLVHAVNFFVLGFVGFMQMNHHSGITELQTGYLTFGLGFYLVDSVFLVLMRHKRSDALLHHLIASAAVALVLHNENWGWLASLYACTAEWGILIYLEAVFKRTNKLTELKRRVLDFYHLVLVLLCRIPLTALITYYVVFVASFTALGKAFAVAYLVLSVYWCYGTYLRFKSRYPEIFGATLVPSTGVEA